MSYTPRYSVCQPTDTFPIVRLDTNDRLTALESAQEGEVVYDWSTGEKITK